MRQLILAFAAAHTVTCLLLLSPVSAASPQPGILQVSLANNTISLGEPLVLVYKVTNAENRKIGSNINDNPRRWLSMSLIDPLGHSISEVAAAAPVPLHSGLALSQENVINANDSPTNFVTGSVIVNQTCQPTSPGQYCLRVSAHQLYYWNEVPNEPVTVDQDFLLPVTVTAKDSQRLHTAAEKLRQAVLHDSKYRGAVEALFSMRDPDCLPVWRELATDPNLDAFRATEAISELVKTGSVSASDLLAEMQPVAPERWSRTGLDPLNALEGMRRNAGPELTQHINHLLVAAGVDLNHVPYGSVN